MARMPGASGDGNFAGDRFSELSQAAMILVALRPDIFGHIPITLIQSRQFKEMFTSAVFNCRAVWCGVCVWV